MGDWKIYCCMMIMRIDDRVVIIDDNKCIWQSLDGIDDNRDDE